MNYQVVRNTKYDYVGQSYASMYPNLHKYPAAMLPQIGVNILKELNVSEGKLLDPYCGSGSSFASGLEWRLSNKAMPSKSPLTNEIGKTVNTMLFEYIVVCEKRN